MEQVNHIYILHVTCYNEMLLLPSVELYSVASHLLVLFRIQRQSMLLLARVAATRPSCTRWIAEVELGSRSLIGGSNRFLFD